MTRPHILQPAQVQRLAEVAAQCGPWSMPVVEALRAGFIAVVFVTRRQRVDLASMRRSPLPLLCWIGDDDEEASTGPDGWLSTPVVTRWAKSAIVHASGGESAHYAEAVRATLVTKRHLLVETSTAHASAWLRLLVGKPALAILPRTGPHPVVPPRGPVH